MAYRIMRIPLVSFYFNPLLVLFTALLQHHDVRHSFTF